MDKWYGGGVGCCSSLQRTVEIFDIYTEESEYIQVAKGEGDDLSPVRGTFGTANTQPIQTLQLQLIPIAPVQSPG